MTDMTPDFHATAPTVSDYTDGTRAVRFVAMQHVAPPAYYEAARVLLREAQQDGYVHFYEFVDMYRLDDTDQRKIRKLTQFLPMPDVYAVVAQQIGEQLGTELVAQQFDDLVGLVNDRDVNADIAPEEFLRRVEETLGTIELTDEDLATPLTEPVSAGIPAEQWMPVVIGSRNAHLAKCVHEAGDERIVISYGAAHEPGWLAELQKLEPAWARAGSDA